MPQNALTIKVSPCHRLGAHSAPLLKLSAHSNCAGLRIDLVFQLEYKFKRCCSLTHVFTERFVARIIILQNLPTVIHENENENTPIL